MLKIQNKNNLWLPFNLLISLFIPFYGMAARGEDLNYGSAHLLMGNPSSATDSMQNPSNYLMLKPQYALSYNRERNIPNWASWQLNDRWLGEAKRQDDFRQDSSLPQGWYRVRPSDYAKSGFDKGHVVSSEDRGRSDLDNSATFFMTNMVPQAPDNNRVVWSQFEAACRSLVKQGKELYIVAGSSGFGGIGSNGERSVLNNNVVVPATIWKVVLVLDRPGMQPKDVTAAMSRTIAIVVPNQQGVKSKPWKDYVTSVDEVEKLTGYDFFRNLPEPVQKIIEAKVDRQTVKSLPE
jgi:endonuclease G, mitochondrial